ncbi:hypothetical protein [Lentibacillus sediminis]|uniref:hypothetical protein n=1 Tax=Lentibacillus sediminis TaxID=1940529 RepID=UPI000C1C1843|nr:hypothetical protein [Lentibacillus sediminis]
MGSNVLFGLYALPVYLLAGTPLSALIVKVINQKSFKAKVTRYFTNFVLYGLAGVISAFVLIMILAIAENELYLIGQDLGAYMLYGITASLIYYHIWLLVSEKKQF